MNIWLDNLGLVGAGGRDDAEGAEDWPLNGFSADMRAVWRRELEHDSVALVTIVGLEGGGPRPVGSQMVVTRDKAEGFLSGGCIENDIALHARECLADGRPRHLVYGRDSPWFDIKLRCGARIDLLVEPIRQGDKAAETLFRLSDARRPATWISDGTNRCCEPADDAPRPWQGAFMRRYDPLPRLVIVGHDPTALAIASLGIQSGFETLLIRPKGPPNPPPLAGLAYSRSAPAQLLSSGLVDPWTSVAICTHDEDIDVESLQASLTSTAGYVGLLGARRRLPQIEKRLLALGVSEQQFARLHAPIGLKLGGRAPFEIAIAVIGEIVAESNAERPADQGSRKLPS